MSNNFQLVQSMIADLFIGCGISLIIIAFVFRNLYKDDGNIIPDMLDGFSMVGYSHFDLHRAVSSPFKLPDEIKDDVYEPPVIVPMNYPTYTEDNCPGHVASAYDGKICGRCGVHIDSLRPPDDPEIIVNEYRAQQNIVTIKPKTSNEPPVEIQHKSAVGNLSQIPLPNPFGDF